MKILYILHTSSFYQGSSRSILTVIENLKESNVKPFVLLPREKDASLCEELDKRNIPYSYIPRSWPVYPASNTLKEKIMFLPELARRIISKIISTICVFYWTKRKSVDIIHTNVGILSEGLWVASICKLPHVWHLREFQDLDFNLKTFYSMDTFRKRIKNSSNYPIAISREIAQHFDLRDDQVIYNGILSKNSVRFNPNKEKFILFAGLLSTGKAIEVLIDAFSGFHERYPDYSLKIAGDTFDASYKRLLYDKVKALNLDAKVEFLGHVNNISVLMYDASVLVVPSKYEGFGRVTVEALYNGCFVLGRNTGGTREIISETGGGLLFDTDEQLLPKLLEIFANGISHYYPTILQAQNMVKELYSIEQNIERVSAHYNKILKYGRETK